MSGRLCRWRRSLAKWVEVAMSVRRLSKPGWADSTLAKKGRSDERNQFFPWSADRGVHDPVDPLEVQAESADDRFSISKNLSILRIDHLPTESSLPGVWR